MKFFPFSMIFCKPINNVTTYDCVSKIPDNVWQSLGCVENFYFSPSYLKSIARHHPNIQFNYLILNDELGNPIALATIQIVDFYLDSVQNEMQTTVDKIKTVGKKLGILHPEKPFKILMCGNAFVSGEHGLFIKHNQNKKEIIKQIAQAISSYVNSEHDLKNKVSAYMLKDFETISLDITNQLHDYNFYSFQVEPNMQFEINESWNSFDDYLAALKTKFRVKARKALKESAILEVQSVTTQNIDQYLPKMQDLYEKVTSNSSFNLGNFNLETYKDLLENIGDNYCIDLYFLHGEMVGFLSGMYTLNSLDAHFVGFDYSLNRKYYIYQRMLYDYIDKAIENRKAILNFGRTASQIKSSVGAIPKDLTIYLRHKKSIPNKILKPFLRRISPTSFRQSKPFKELESL